MKRASSRAVSISKAGLLALVVGAIYGSSQWSSFGPRLASTTMDPAMAQAAGLIRPVDAIPAATLFFAAVVITLWLRRDRDSAVGIGVLLFGIRAALALGSVYFYVGQDELILHEHARLLACCGVQSLGELLSTGQGYPLLVSFLYAALGPNIFIPKLMNAFLGTLVAFLLSDIARAIWNSSVITRRVLVIAGLLPPLLIYSALNLKEIPATFLLVGCFWVLFVPRWRLSVRVAASLLVVVTLFALRGEWAAFGLVAPFAYLLVVGRRRGEGEAVWRRLLVAAAVGGALLVPLQPLIASSTSLIRERIFIGSQASFGTFNTASGSATRDLVGDASPFSAKSVGIQVLRAPFSPSPTDVFLAPSSQTLLDSVVAATAYVLFPLSLIALVRWRTNRRVLTIAIVGALLFGVVALSLLLGLNLARHSIPLFAFLYLFGAAGWDLRQRYALPLFLWGAAAVLYSLVYVIVKSTAETL